MHCIQRFKIQDSSSSETQSGYNYIQIQLHNNTLLLAVCQYTTQTQVRDKGKLQRYGTSDKQHLYRCATTLEITKHTGFHWPNLLPYTNKQDSTVNQGASDMTPSKPLACIGVSLLWCDCRPCLVGLVCYASEHILGPATSVIM